MFHSRIWSTLLSIPLLLPLPLHGQLIYGTIVDAENQRPVASARVLISDPWGDTLATTVTDEKGRFAMEAPEKGTFRVRVTSLGYAEVTSRWFGGSEEREAIHLEMRLPHSPLGLSPLNVTVERQNRLLAEAGFYERRREFGEDGLNVGHFLDPEEIEGVNPYRVTDILRLVPGLHLTFPQGRTTRVRLGKGIRACTPKVYVNDVPRNEDIHLGGGVDEAVTGSSIIGVEIYDESTMPARYLDEDWCGAIILWTR